MCGLRGRRAAVWCQDVGGTVIVNIDTFARRSACSVGVDWGVAGCGVGKSGRISAGQQAGRVACPLINVLSPGV